MRVLVMSDVHANLVALEAVLDDAGDLDIIWSLGDIVGYGPQPNECIELLLTRDHVAIAGNHDWGALGKIDLSAFNVDARRASLWTREQLNPRSWSYLDTMPTVLVEDDWTLAHGSPRDPIWEYLIYCSVAAKSFEHFDTDICFVGHTHLPVIFVGADQDRDCTVVQPLVGTPVTLGDRRYIINPGSVGQPRDGDPRAAYLILDTVARTVEQRRVAYDVRLTQERMRAQGLPERSTARLQFGW